MQIPAIERKKLKGQKFKVIFSSTVSSRPSEVVNTIPGHAQVVRGKVEELVKM